MTSENTEVMRPLELTLIVAATAKNMGIGRAGGLPWTGLKKEMAYFARVTKRVPSSAENPSLHNALLMGRKTWSSIPPKFRPLKSRQNIVLSRSFPPPSANTSLSTLDYDSAPLELPSLPAALQALSQSTSTARAFVIGGADIYKAALDEPATKRILLTRVLGEFECDTFFPVTLNEGDPDGSSGWKRISQEEMDEWVGEEVPRGVQSEADTEYVFEMWER